MSASPPSDPATTRPERHRGTPARVAGIYLVSSLTWIWLSDISLIRAGIQGEPGFWASVSKGSAFVLISAGVLYGLIRREVRHLTRALGLLRAVTEGTTDAVFVKDRAGKYLLFNEAAARFVGKPVAEVLGKDDTEHFDPRSAALVRASDLTVMESGRAEMQQQSLTAAGVTRTYMTTKAPYRDAAGTVIGVVGIARDISDRERAEAERLAHLTERRRAAALLGHQNRVLELIATGAPLADTFDEIVQIVEKEIPGVVCSILLLDRDGLHLRVGAAPNLPPAYNAAVDGVAIGPRVGSCGTAAYTREPVNVADVATDPLWADYKDLALAHGLRACWSTPILGAARGAAPRAVLGTFAVYAREPGAPDPRFAELIGRVEHLASVAIESDRADREVREGHAFREAVIRAAGEGICVCARVPEFPHLRFTVWNDRMVELTGYTMEEINRLGWYQTLYPDPELRDRVVARMERMREGDDLRAEEWTLTRRDGERRVVAISTSVVQGEDGNSAVVALMLDVTGRKRTEESLRRSEERFRAAMVGSLDAVYFLTAVRDPDGRIADFTFADVNPKGEALLALPRNEIVGQRLCELLPVNRTGGFCDRYARVVETRTPLEEEFPVTEAGIAAGWLHHQVVPLGDGVVITSRNITARKHAELALRASEARFRAYVDHAADGLALHDEHGTVVDVNSQACESLGYSRDELIGMFPTDFDPDATPESVARMLARLAAGETVAFDSRHRRKDGTTFPVEVRIRPFKIDGAWFGLALARDITERKRAEESLRQSEERYRDLVELSPEGVSILHEGRFVYVNRSGAGLVGLAPPDLVGRALAEFLHPDDHAVSRERQSAVTQKGEEVPLRQFRVRHADGTWRIVEACAGPCRFEGRPAVQIISRDATERIRAEQALREHEEHLRIFVDHVWAPIAMFDREMRYIHISRRWLTDYRLGARDIIGLSHYEVFPEIPERWKEVHRRCLAGAVERCEDDRFERADGTVQWLRWEIQPWRQADGAVGGIVMFTEDVTARKRMEAHYQQAQKMEAVGRLAGGIAHDFNNLLTIINGFAELMLRGMDPADPHRDALGHVRGAGDRAARLTQQLLAYSRKAMIEPKVLDLNELVDESAKMLRRLIGEDVVIATVFRPGGARIRADRGHVEQVLLNLVINARDAMPTGGRVTVETGTVALGPDQLPDDPDLKPGRYVRLTVTDTGAGMTEAVRANIFEPFFTTKGVGQGTGLGLAVVQGAVKQSGGHIEVASALGVGTTFTLLFPSVPERTGPASEASEPSARGTETVLLVEDEDAVRAISRLSLEAFGYTVIAVDGGADALRAAEAHAGAIDLLVTDVVMPEMGGRELAEALRRREPGLRVLFMSGYTDDVMLRHGLTDSTDAFLQKPFTPQALARKVREMLDRGR